jgi:hypothetical protein
MYEVEGEEELSPAEQMIQKLIDMASKGEFDNDQIRNLGQQLTSARKRYFTAQRSPESYKSAAEKAKQTKAKNDADSEIFLAKSRERDIQTASVMKARHDGGMLPYRLDDYSKKPNPKYYTFIMNDPGSGVGLYKLRDEYKNTVIGTKNPDGTVNPVIDADIYASPGVKPSMKAYMEETKNNKMKDINLNRWAKLAGINEALDAQSLIGKYVTLSQNVSMSGYNPKTAQDVIDIMPKFTNPAFGIKIHDTDPGKASWGSAVYLIQQDGSLKTVSSNYDTSG